MVTVELNVTHREINAGVGGSCKDCPVALAAKKAGFSSPFVSRFLTFSDPRSLEARYSTNLPSNAMDFIETFDDYAEGIGGPKKPRPIKVCISIPNRIAKLLNIKRRYIVA